MSDLKWFAMPVGFYSQLGVVRIRTKYKSVGLGVISQLLELIALSPDGHIRGAMKQVGEGWIADPCLADYLAGLVGSSAEIVADIITALLDEGIIELSGNDLWCSFISASLGEQQRIAESVAARVARHRAKKAAESTGSECNALRNSYSNVTVTPSKQLRNAAVTTTDIHTDRHTYRQTDKRRPAIAGGALPASLKSIIKSEGGAI